MLESSFILIWDCFCSISDGKRFCLSPQPILFHNGDALIVCLVSSFVICLRFGFSWHKRMIWSDWVQSNEYSLSSRKKNPYFVAPCCTSTTSQTDTRKCEFEIQSLNRDQVSYVLCDFTFIRHDEQPDNFRIIEKQQGRDEKMTFKISTGMILYLNVKNGLLKTGLFSIFSHQVLT